MQWLTRHNSTWIYENWVGRHFEISVNFPGLLSHLFLVVSWLGICVEVVVDRISWIRVLSNTRFSPTRPYRAREVGERTWERGCSRLSNWVCIAKYLTVFTFHLTKLIKSPWSWLKQKGTILFAFLRSPLRFWPWKQRSRSQIYLARAKLQANFDQGQDVKTESMLVCRACDGTSGKLNTTRVREMCSGVYLSKVSGSPSYLMTFSSVKREKIMRGCG